MAQNQGAIRVQLDLSKANVFLTSTSQKALQKAVSRSIQRTLAFMNTAIGKEVSQERMIDTKRMPISAVKKRFLLQFKRTSSNTSISAMYGKVTITSRKSSLYYFFAKAVRVTAKNGRVLYGATAIVNGRNVRLGRAFPTFGTGRSSTVSPMILARAGDARLPVRKLYGPSFATMFTRTPALGIVSQGASQKFEQEFEHNLEHYLAQSER